MSAGYSGTPLGKKLGIKQGTVVVTIDAPENYVDLLGPLPEAVRITDKLQPDADVIHIFTNTRDGLFKAVSEARHLIKQNGSIWVSWYKKAAKLPTEITEDTVREAAFPLGLVDVKVCAVDIRKENRI